MNRFALGTHGQVGELLLHFSLLDLLVLQQFLGLTGSLLGNCHLQCQLLHLVTEREGGREGEESESLTAGLANLAF